MAFNIIAYLSTAFIFLAIDFVWIGFIARNFYKTHLGHLMLDQPNLPIAALFYLIYALAVTVLAVMPALRSGDWLIALSYGALLGFAAYGTYDITNLATLKNWPVIVSVVDVIWGTVLTATVATSAYHVTRYFSGT